MDPTYPDDPIYRIMEHLLSSYVEDGTLEVGERPIEEILLEYKALIQVFLADNTELIHIPDHRTELFQRAQDEAANGNPNLAVTLCALWIEHAVNGVLIAALERNGYQPEEIVALIRDISFRNKITVIWKMIGLTPLEEAHIRLADQIMQARNAFVHYKWRPRDDVEYQAEFSQFRSLVARSHGLNEAFERAHNIFHWNGRQDEVIDAYRQDIARHIDEIGPFTMQGPPPEEGASGSPEPS